MIKYGLITRKNPITKEYMYHGYQLPVTPIKLDALAEEISGKCTVTVHDIKAVISALEESIYQHLRNGESVRLGDLGSFRTTLSSSGTVTEEEFSPENLRGLLVRFTPSSKMRFELSLANPRVSLSRVEV